MARPELAAIETRGALDQLELKIRFSSEAGRSRKSEPESRTNRPTMDGRTRGEPWVSRHLSWAMASSSEEDIGGDDAVPGAALRCAAKRFTKRNAKQPAKHQETLNEAPYETPHETPQRSTPTKNPRNTPRNATRNTPRTTPRNTPRNTTQNTSRNTPRKTPLLGPPGAAWGLLGPPGPS